jgi:hypothetical protein
MAEDKFYFDVDINIRDKGVADDPNDTIDAYIKVKRVHAKDGHHAAALAMQRLELRWKFAGWGFPVIRSVTATHSSAAP